MEIESYGRDTQRGRNISNFDQIRISHVNRRHDTGSTGFKKDTSFKLRSQNLRADLLKKMPSSMLLKFVLMGHTHI